MIEITITIAHTKKAPVCVLNFVISSFTTDFKFELTEGILIIVGMSDLACIFFSAMRAKIVEESFCQEQLSSQMING